MNKKEKKLAIGLFSVLVIIPATDSRMIKECLKNPAHIRDDIPVINYNSDYIPGFQYYLSAYGMMNVITPSNLR